MDGPQSSWNQHDDEPCDLDLENVVGMLQRVQQVAAASSPSPTDPSGASQPNSSDAAGGKPAAAGWDGFNSWMQSQRVAPVPMQPLLSTGTPLGASTPPHSNSRGGGAVTPPHQRCGEESAGWESAFASMATPPRMTSSSANGGRGGGSTGGHSTWVALPSDYAVAPTTVSSRAGGPRTPSMAGRDDSMPGHHLALSGGHQSDVWSSERRPMAMGSAARRTGAPLLYSISSPTKDTSSSSAGSPNTLPATGGSSDAAAFTSPPRRPQPHTPVSAASLAYGGRPLSTQAAPFTPKRSGAFEDSPHHHQQHASAAFHHPHTSMLATPPRSSAYAAYHNNAEAASLTPQALPPGWSDPGLGATPQPHGGHAMPYGGYEAARAHPVAAAKDQLGCRTLQRLFDLPWHTADVQEVYAMLFPALPELMSDAYGNFLVQKLLECAPDAERLDMTRLVAPHLPAVAVTPHGTFAAQKLVDSLRGPEERLAVCAGLASSIVPLCTDPNGAHVVQKVIAAVGASDRLLLVRGIASNVNAIGNNRYGTCIVQRCLERTLATPAHFNILAEAIVASCATLVLNPFGNYVVQRLVDQCESCSPAIDAVVRTLTAAGGTADPATGHPLLRTLVVSQFSSKAVEKSVQRASPGVAAAFAQEVGRPEVLSAAIGDQFGNYIVQTALALASTVFAAPPHLPATASQQQQGGGVLTPAPSTRPAAPFQPATVPAAADLGSLTVTAGGELPAASLVGSPTEDVASMARADAAAAGGPPAADADALAALSAFVDSVAAHISLVRGCGFQKKMEHRLEQAVRTRRGAATTPTTTTATAATGGRASGAGTPHHHNFAAAAAANPASPPQRHGHSRSAGPGTPSSQPATPGQRRGSAAPDHAHLPQQQQRNGGARGGRGSPAQHAATARNGSAAPTAPGGGRQRGGSSAGVSPLPDRDSPALEPTQRRRPPQKGGAHN